MNLTWADADELLGRHGPSVYLFDAARFRENVMTLRDAMSRLPGVELAYSYKTNYTPAVCLLADELGMLAEVVSPMDWWLVNRVGVQPTRVICNGPATSPAMVRDAVLAGAIVNLDSRASVDAVLALATEFPERSFGVGLRCSFPVASVTRPRLGFAATEVERVALELGAAGVRVIGLHVHVPDQSIASVRERAQGLVRLADVMMPGGPEFLDLGGSLFGRIPIGHDSEDHAPSFADYATALAEVLQPALDRWERKPRIILEPGAALVADAFGFATRVLDVKSIDGRVIATTAGSVLDTSPNTRRVDFPLQVLRGPRAPAFSATAFDAGGYTSIDGDYLALQVPGPVAVDDILLFENVGAYSVVMRPPFISPAWAIVQWGPDGSTRTLRAAQAFADVFSGFAF